SNVFGEVKLPLQRDICLPGSKTAQHIAPEIALLPGWCRSKSYFIEDLAARILLAKEFKRHSGLYVGGGRKQDAPRKGRCANNVDRRCRSCQDESVHRPVVQYCFRNWLCPGKWHVVSYAGGERMPDVKV